MRTFLILIFTSLIFFSSTLCQTTSKPLSLKYWAQAGAGLSFVKFTNSDVGLSVAGAVVFDYDHHLFSVKYNHNYEIGIFVSPLDELWSTELLYGRRMDFIMRGMCLPFFPFGLLIKREFNYSFNVYAGISLLGSHERIETGKDKFFNPVYSSENSSYVGFPVEIELVERFNNNIGLGLTVYANFNESKDFIGVRSNLYLGFF